MKEKDNNKPNNGRPLRPRARILRTLGEELISSETVAMIELVKNAYDADAHTVLIRFSGALKADVGDIEVFDDGHGMTMEVIDSAWMEPATDVKKKQLLSKTLGRRVLGEKGIGRFAASRLARELELTTRPKDSGREIYGIFDWRQFDDEGRYLDEVIFLVEERETREIKPGWVLTAYQDEVSDKWPRSGTQGTILRMNGLKRDWGREDLVKLQRGLSRLVSPFSPTPGFRIFLELPEGFKEFSQQIEPPEIIKYPHYSIRGHVEEDGSYRFEIRLEVENEPHIFTGRFGRARVGQQTEVVDRWSNDDAKPADQENLHPIECGPFEFELRVWDRDELGNVEQKLGKGIRDIQRDLNAIAGINIYRDGFRVLPYGEPDNDWLRLDIRRVQKPTYRLSNNQVTGYVAISADRNPQLRDRSNREGLDNSPGYTDLREILLQILTKLEAKRHAKKREPPVTDKKEGSLFSKPDLGEIRRRLEAVLPGDKETLKLLDKSEKEWEAKIGEIKSVLSRYHSLATLGSLIDKVLHEGRQPLSSIQHEAGLGEEQIAEYLDAHQYHKTLPLPVDSLQKSRDRFRKITAQADVLHTTFKRVEPFGGRRSGRPKKFYLEEILRETFSLYEPEIIRLGVRTTLPGTDTLVRVDEAELREIFVNLLTNSLYWLATTPKEKRSIAVTVAKSNTDELEIVFSDTGPGVPAEYRDSIFEPYFSLKPEGVGLGLSIVGEIVKDYYNGSFFLLDTGPLGGSAFKIVLRKRI